MTKKRTASSYFRPKPLTIQKVLEIKERIRDAHIEYHTMHHTYGGPVKELYIKDGLLIIGLIDLGRKIRFSRDDLKADSRTSPTITVDSLVLIDLINSNKRLHLTFPNMSHMRIDLL